MDSNPIVLDISSDEDTGWGEPDCDGDTSDWLSELLGQIEGKVDDSDEVTVIGEVAPKLKTKFLTPPKSSDNDSDDDCAILDGDPNNPVSSLNDSATGADELLIVGEKGQIACRDYPHPRNLCAKFPFASTLHEKHCDLCHCYVCDSPAPCAFWFIGLPLTDHCHATDKDEVWKVLRRNLKGGNKVSSLFPIHPMMPPLPYFHQPNTSQGNRVTPIHALSSSLNPSIPNIGTPQPRLGPVVPTTRCQTPWISRPHGTQKRTFRHHVPGSLGSRFGSPRVISKKPRYYQNAYRASINFSHTAASETFTTLHSVPISTGNSNNTNSLVPASCLNQNPRAVLNCPVLGSNQSSAAPLLTPSLGSVLNCQGNGNDTNSPSPVLGLYPSSAQVNVGSGFLGGYSTPSLPLCVSQPNGGQLPFQQGNRAQPLDLNLSCCTDDGSFCNLGFPMEPPVTVTEVPGAGGAELPLWDFEFASWVGDAASGGAVDSDLNGLPHSPAPAIDPGLLSFHF